MDDATQTFHRHRPRLLGIAYRMLGTRAEAEEVVQDAWLRWHDAAPDVLDSAEAWLVTVTTRLAIDRLRAAKVAREHYVGLWLPEPVLTDTEESPETALERVGELSIAFLAVLERLSPEARAAFLLREIFDTDYDEVARILGKTEAACRQLVHRARSHVQAGRPRFAAPPEAQRRLLESFAAAAAQGNIAQLTALLAEDAELIGDGGGKVASIDKVLVGAHRLANLYHAVWRRNAATMRIQPAEINGEPGLLRFFDGVLESVQSFEIADGRIVRIHTQRNPDKLARIVRALGA